MPSRSKTRAVPFGVALGEVVVDGHEVDALAGERVQVERQARDERLSFTGLHLGDVALVQDDPAHHLDVEDALVGLAQARFAHGGERFEEDVLELLAVREPLAELDRLPAQLLVGELPEVGLQRRDVGRLLGEALHAPPFAEAEGLFEGSRAGIRDRVPAPSRRGRLHLPEVAGEPVRPDDVLASLPLSGRLERRRRRRRTACRRRGAPGPPGSRRARARDPRGRAASRTTIDEAPTAHGRPVLPARPRRETAESSAGPNGVGERPDAPRRQVRRR